jgi:hypothetical protein
MTRGDKILTGALLALIGCLAVWLHSGAAPGGWVVVEVNAEPVSRVPLAIDRTLDVQGALGAARIEIRGGRVRFAQSPCKGKICVKAGFVQYAGRYIACVPNRVTVRIEGAQQQGLDAIVG